MTDDKKLWVGIGSPHGDDRVGWEVVQALADLDPGLRVQCLDVPIDLLDLLEGVGQLTICDACRTGDPPGAIHRWSWPCGELRRVEFMGTHDFGLVPALELADRLGLLPNDTTLFGIDVFEVRPGASLSRPLRVALPSFARIIREQRAFHFI
ncbi:MAG TPA: hydrogenase maturation protease [Pirellulales bacterium]|nr:hydrogenase maturation protease [Pirellulales bacterium]